ncbi:MAG: glycosyltransferase [Oligoflexia bacterium]|nr:glycosyltransferase [Oligoflexia bacterium]
MQIAMISANYPPAICGIGDYTYNLCSELEKKNIKITHFYQKSDLISKWNNMDVLKLYNYLNNSEFDLIHLQYEPYGFKRGFLLPILLSRVEKPLILTAHEVFHRYKIEKIRDSFLYKKSKFIIVNDQGSLKSLEKIDSTYSKKTRIFGVGSNISNTELEYKVKDSNIKKIIHFGKINKNRKLEILIKALKNLKNTHLTLIGPFNPKKENYHKELDNLVLSHNLKDKITFTGELENKEIASLIISQDLAVLPFIDGASPRHGTLQACADLGMPIITTKPTAFEPDFEHLKNVYFCQANEVDFTKAISELIKNKELLKTLSIGAKQYSLKYKWPKIADMHLDIYKAVSNRHE